MLALCGLRNAAPAQRPGRACANGVVYVGSFDNNVYALDAATGALKWSYTTGNFIDSSPAVADGVVYIGSGDQRVYAFGLPG